MPSKHSIFAARSYLRNPRAVTCLCLLCSILCVLCGCTVQPGPKETATKSQLYTVTQAALPAAQPAALQSSVPEPQTQSPSVTPDPNEELLRPQVLMYHAVSDTPWSSLSSLFVRPAELREQIDALLAQGYTFCFADEYADSAQKSVILTFDDGYEDNYTELLPILLEKKVVATVFIISDMVDTEHYLTTEQILQMDRSGVIRFGCHTASHPYLTELSAQAQRTEMQSCKAYLEELLQKPCRSIAYPYGDYNASAYACAADLFDFGYSTNDPRSFPRHSNSRCAIPRHFVCRGMGTNNLLAKLD